MQKVAAAVQPWGRSMLHLAALAAFTAMFLLLARFGEYGDDVKM